MVAVVASNVAATAARLNFADVAAGTASIDVQLSPRLDFKWCICPIFNVPNAAFYDAAGLNQVQTYYGRAREIIDGQMQGWGPTFAFRTPQAAPQVTAPDAVMIDPAIVMPLEPVLSWTPSAAVAGFPATNLGRDAPVGWKVVAAAPTLTIEMGGSPWDGLALLNSNLPEAATVTLRGGASAAAAAGAAPMLNAVPFRASANLPGRYGYHGWFPLAAPVEHKFAHITLGGQMPPANTVYIEHALIGRARKSKNHAVEKTESGLDLGSLERSRTGVPDRLIGLRMRRVEFDIALMTESQYETLYGDLSRLLGETEPLFVVPNSKRNFAFHDRMLYGNLSGGRVVNPASPYYTRSFTMDSIV